MHVHSVWRLAQHLSFLCMVALFLTACAGRPGAPTWGANATIAPSLNHLGKAALRAAADPLTWGPAVGAALLQIGDLDEEIADWANKERPLFSSRDRADSVSDWLRVASFATYLGVGLSTPVAEEDDWLGAKVRGFAPGAAAIAATEGITTLGKEATDRERPLGQDDASFPSGHASLTAVSARLSRETLRFYDLSPDWQLAADAGLAGLTVATAWARLEAGQHHPADVLAGAALGNFFAVFFTEAFLRPALGQRIVLHVERPFPDGWAFSATFHF